MYVYAFQVKQWHASPRTTLAVCQPSPDLQEGHVSHRPRPSSSSSCVSAAICPRPYFVLETRSDPCISLCMPWRYNGISISPFHFLSFVNLPSEPRHEGGLPSPLLAISFISMNRPLGFSGSALRGVVWKILFSSLRSECLRL